MSEYIKFKNENVNKSIGIDGVVAHVSKRGSYCVTKTIVFNKALLKLPYPVGNSISEDLTIERV